MQFKFINSNGEQTRSINKGNLSNTRYRGFLEKFNKIWTIVDGEVCESFDFIGIFYRRQWKQDRYFNRLSAKNFEYIKRSTLEYERNKEKRLVYLNADDWSVLNDKEKKEVFIAAHKFNNENKGNTIIKSQGIRYFNAKALHLNRATNLLSKLTMATYRRVDGRYTLKKKQRKMNL